MLGMLPIYIWKWQDMQDFVKNYGEKWACEGFHLEAIQKSHSKGVLSNRLPRRVMELVALTPLEKGTMGARLYDRVPNARYDLSGIIGKSYNLHQGHPYTTWEY